MHIKDYGPLLNNVKELIAIESTADNPTELKSALDYVEQFVRARVPDVTIEQFERNGKPSFLAYRGATRPKKFHIILNGHVDVVAAAPEQFHAIVEDDKLYGRGANDMKAAVIVLADVFCEFVKEVPYALGLQIVTDEETNGHNGTLYQIEQRVRSDFILCGDCGRTTTNYVIANEAKGAAIVRIALTGRAAHGAYPWRGDNAAVKAAHFVHAVHNRYPAPTEATGDTTVTVTSILTSGGGVNQIPGYAVATIDARYAAGDPHFADLDHFTTLLADIDPSAEIIEVIDFSSPMYTSPDNTVIQLLKKAAETVEKTEFSFIKNNGSSDGRHFGAVGVAACEFGIAGEGQHSSQEYIPLPAFYAYHATLTAFLTETMVVSTSKALHPQEQVDLITPV